MNRKDFLKNASAATVLAYFGLSLESCSSDSEDTTPMTGNPNNDQTNEAITFELTESPFSDLQQDGGWLLHPNENILLVNVGGSISAFTSVCTHSGCTRNWTFPSDLFECTCHGSRFDTNGQVVRGPAGSPLARINVSQDGNTVTLG